MRASEHTPTMDAIIGRTSERQGIQFLHHLITYGNSIVTHILIAIDYLYQPFGVWFHTNPAPAPTQRILGSKLDFARQKYVPNKKGGSLQKSLVVLRWLIVHQEVLF